MVGITETPSSASFSRYLEILGVVRKPPSHGALSELVRAQLVRCPFENVSKLYRVWHLGLRELPDLEAFLDGIERHRLGGTCYTNNYFFYSLLIHLGYDASFCGAAMDVPDIHTTIIVTLDRRRFFVDVGYGAPFYGPIPLDAPPQTRIVWGRNEFVVRPLDDTGGIRVDHCRNGEGIHGYTVNPTPRSITHFALVIRDSLADSAYFMNRLRLERFAPGYSVSLDNRALWISRPGGFESRRLDSEAEVRAAIDEHFGVPRSIIDVVLEGLGDRIDA